MNKEPVAENIFLHSEKDIDLYNIFSGNDIDKFDDEQNYFSNFSLNENDYNNSYIFEDYLLEEEKIKSIINERQDHQDIISHISSEEKFDNDKNNQLLGKKHYINNESKITFKKNRNNFNKNIFKISNDNNGNNSNNSNNNNNNNNLTSETSSSNHHIDKISNKTFRSDSLIIKFKSFLGKSFISYINNKLKNLTKRRIKFFSFNYKKFTLNATYSENKKWLDEKMKNLLVLGGEPNQAKNEKALKSLYRRKEEEFDEIKDILESTYKDIIERFYESEYFEEFKKDEKVIILNDNFSKIMNISLLDKNGFIVFLNTRKGNKEKMNDSFKDEI
jgi:hypothetical protein